MSNNTDNSDDWRTVRHQHSSPAVPSDPTLILNLSEPEVKVALPDGGQTPAEEWRERIAGTWTESTEPYLLSWDDPSNPVVADVDGQLKYISNGHVGPVKIDVEQLAELLEQFGEPTLSPLSAHRDEFDRELMEWTPDRRRSDGGTAAAAPEAICEFCGEAIRQPEQRCPALHEGVCSP